MRQSLGSFGMLNLQVSLDLSCSLASLMTDQFIAELAIHLYSVVLLASGYDHCVGKATMEGSIKGTRRGSVSKALL